MTAALTIAIGGAVISLLTLVYNIRRRHRLLRRCHRAEAAANTYAMMAARAQAQLEERGPAPAATDAPTGLDRLDPRPLPRRLG